MKTRNAILGAAAFTIAIGSAFATVLAPTTIFVKARLTSPTSPIVCQNTGVTCDDSGSIPCRVQVNVVSGQNNTSKTYKNSSCTTALTNTASPAVVSSTNVYQLTEIQ
jgi:hypothetical protein